MRNRIIRILLFSALIVALGFLFNFVLTQFSGDGKNTPEEALPADEDYEWIEGPKSEKEHRYFFLSNGNYFGTGVVTKNLRGWSTGDGSFANMPNPLEDNKISSAYSDSKVLFGLIKRNGNVKVTVNGEQASFIELSTLSDEVLTLYNAKGYSIWYIDLLSLKQQDKFSIKVLDENNDVISELSI